MGNSSSSHGKLHKLHYNGAASSRDHLSSSSSSERFTSGPPSAPGKPYLVVADPADEPDVITVKWKPPARDSGSKITGYIVEHRRTISPHWVKATPGKVQHNQLTLSGLEPGWRYQFRVKAFNASGQSPPSVVSDPVTMTVHRTAVVAPVFVCGIEDRVALENDQVKFEVEFEGTPTPKISWYKDGFELFSNRRQRVNTDNGMSTLYIHQAEYSDEGEIKCSATNRAGHAITKARLRLEAPPMVRLPQDYEDGLLLEQNEPMRLKVSVSGRPLPQVTWLHDGEEIRGGDRFEVIHTDKYAALKLACVKRSDRGCYQIQAVNPLGEHMASFLVTVTDRPSQPGKVHVSKTSGKSVTLSWKPPEDDGGCKIGNYIIEYNRVGWDMWLKASTSRQLTADLDDLLEGSEYRFRVKAENPYGMSLPSEVSEPIFLPDIKRGIYKPVVTAPLLFEDEEKLIKIQETEMLEYFGRKSKSPEPLSKARKLSVDEVSPPVPKRRKKKSKTDLNSSEVDIYKSFSFLDVSTETCQQPIEQKDHWGLPPGLKTNSGRISQEDLTNSQIIPMNCKTKRNSTDSLLLLNFERGSAPPISLSSPELGAESEGFEEQIRNSYSSSELLYERNLNRFNGYSNDENLSSEAQKIAIYAMDRKNSLRRSPITRRSNDGSEEKSIFSDSDSVHSVIDISKRKNASSFMSLANSIEEEIVEGVKETIDNDETEQSTSFSGVESETSIESDDDYNMSDRSEEKFTNFGSGKRALEQNTSSAFFSTVYYDDDYMSDQKLSDREQSKSPAKLLEKADEGLSTSATKSSENSDRRSPTTQPAEETSEQSDSMSQDSLNYSNGSINSSEYSRSDEHKSDTAEISTVETLMDGSYRPRDGIPKYVMLPNPFYKENSAASESTDLVKFKLSSDTTGIIPPEIPERETGIASGVRQTLPVITVTEMSDRSPKSVLKKIFVPPFFSKHSNGPDRDKYDDQMSRKKSPVRDSKNVQTVSNGEDAIETPVVTADTGTNVNADSCTDTDASAATEIIAVRHYGDIVEQYSGVSRRPVAKTYLDFEQLKMAAATENCDEPVVTFEAGLRDNFEDDDDVDEDYANDEYFDESGDCSLTTLSGQPEVIEDPAASGEWLSAVVLHQPNLPEPYVVPYLKIFGNLSLAVFGYWLYMCKDEKLSVPVFGFLLFRFFKTQIWDRI
ncbi:muscle M-line assembly protein unc-89 [Rhopalosiphum padi]|uniref:muscle M-line assembly protein unc-89 n=1 Tax=Rhopalosiphum padi TaxID=40932 RepID=UPI00298E3553|nr:muscle M-line assembly protein unc-89 [Rhopalosiphum padi]